MSKPLTLEGEPCGCEEISEVYRLDFRFVVFNFGMDKGDGGVRYNGT